MNVDEAPLLLVISEDEGLEWIQMVQEAWHTEGQTVIVSKGAISENGHPAKTIPSSILIDASSIHCDLVAFVKKMRQQYKAENVPIVVASASPTWEQARDVFQAGAADYIKRTTDIQSLVTLLRNYVNTKPPPRN